MCGTFSQREDGRVVIDAWAQQDSAQLRRKPLKVVDFFDEPKDTKPIARYPGQSAYVLLNTKLDEVRLQKIPWGLVPHWAKDPSEFKGKLFNARSETVAELPAFRDAFAQWRCIVPTFGYWEFKRPDGQKAERFSIDLNDKLIWMAGIFSVRRSEQPKLSFSILTQAPQGHLCEVHHRKPLMLKDLDQATKWLAGSSVESIQFIDEKLLAITSDPAEHPKSNKGPNQQTNMFE